ncbi:hypothetical protein COO60DRAFT_1704354 [Scenedesmus sp. NREL 46B-D3]|nr:hypothetical protein COO60DRAFT_1704354 [Scenedesmus sp. NREL 46B-D3]
MLNQVASIAAGKLLLGPCSRLLQAGPIRALSALDSSSSSSSACGTATPHTVHHASQQQQRLWPWQVPHTRQLGSSSGAGHSQQQQDSGQQQQRGATPTEEAKNYSKAFLTSVLDAEDLWLKGVAGQLKMWEATKKVPLEEKQQEAVVERCREAYLSMLQRNAAGRVMSHRARSHLRQACLAAATHKVLLEEAPHAESLIDEFVHFSMGGVYSSFMLGGLKVSSWAKRLLLRESSISQAVDTLHTIARDMEGACHCSVQPLAAGGSDEDELEQQQQAQPQGEQQQGGQAQQGEQRQGEDPEAAAEKEAAQLHVQAHWQAGAALTVDSCMIAEVLQAEGAPQLLRHFCCQHNMRWLEAFQGQGVKSHLEACIAKDDPCCRMIVAPAD